MQSALNIGYRTNQNPLILPKAPVSTPNAIKKVETYGIGRDPGLMQRYNIGMLPNYRIQTPVTRYQINTVPETFNPVQSASAIPVQSSLPQKHYVPQGINYNPWTGFSQAKYSGIQSVPNTRNPAWAPSDEGWVQDLGGSWIKTSRWDTKSRLPKK